MPALDDATGIWSRSTPSMALISWLVVCVVCVIAMPATVLLLGPLVFGVPHVLSELRVLARRVQVRRNALLLILAPLALLVLVRIGEQLGMARPASSDVVLGCAAMFVAAAVRPGDSGDRAARLLIVIGASVFALYDTRLTTLLLAHFHNLIALLFLFAWSRSMGGARERAILLMGVAAAAAVLSFAPIPESATPFVTELQFALAPGLTAELGYKLVLVYAFAQLLHYVIWLVWMPGLDSTGTKREFRGDRWFAAALIVIAFSVPLLAIFENPIASRDQYLALSSFHGWLELAVLTYCGLRRRVD